MKTVPQHLKHHLDTMKISNKEKPSQNLLYSVVNANEVSEATVGTDAKIGSVCTHFNKVIIS